MSQPVPVPVPPISDPRLRDEESRILGGGIGDRLYQAAITFFALCVPLLLALIAIEIVVAAWR